MLVADTDGECTFASVTLYNGTHTHRHPGQLRNEANTTRPTEKCYAFESLTFCEASNLFRVLPLLLWYGREEKKLSYALVPKWCV